MLGTPDFIAPEQIIDARQADIRADIYSLGCTLYYLLTGGPPFQGTSLYDILQAHHSRDALPLNLARPEVPVELAALVAKMMAKEPERRFQEPEDVAQALTPFFKKGSQGLVSTEGGGFAAGQDVADAANGRHAFQGGPAGDGSWKTGCPAQKLAEPTAAENQWESLVEFRVERTPDRSGHRPLIVSTGHRERNGRSSWQRLCSA